MRFLPWRLITLKSFKSWLSFNPVLRADVSVRLKDKILLEHSKRLHDRTFSPECVWATHGQNISARSVDRDYRAEHRHVRPSKKKNLVNFSVRPMKKIPTQLFKIFLYYINTVAYKSSVTKEFVHFYINKPTFTACVKFVSSWLTLGCDLHPSASQLLIARNPRYIKNAHILYPWERGWFYTYTVSAYKKILKPFPLYPKN
jgi:hypothetical protein